VIKGASVAGLSMALPVGAVANSLGAGEGPVSNPAPASIYRWPVRPLIKPNLANALESKAKSKPVRRTLVIDDMETDRGWTASNAVTMTYTNDRAKSGARSLRCGVEQRNEAYIRASRQPNGSFSGQGVLFDSQPFAAAIRLKLDPPQDWSNYNRVSLWCFLHPTATTVTSLSLGFTCQGATGGPSDPIAVHYIGDLISGDWNHLTWEISEYQRDKVVEFVLFEPVAGIPVRNAESTLIFDFDQFALEQVEVEPVGGWAVSLGKIAFSHIGYQPSAPKVAIAGDGPEGRFTLVDASDGAVAATFPAAAITTRRGRYRRLDFSAFAQPGRYRLRYGDTESGVFGIGDDAWRSLTDKTLNAVYGMRCGFATPGVHDACHLDVLVKHAGETRVVGGGWHDAANLSQNAGNTHLMIYALLQLHSQLAGRKADADLVARVREEALWGLEWSQRMRFGPGLRCNRAGFSYYTDNIVGTLDDVVQENVGVEAFQNTLAALASACGATNLAPYNRELAKALLVSAEEDYQAVVSTITAPPTAAQSIEINQASWRDQSGYLTLAAVELFRATGASQYADDAARFAKWLLDVQERRFVEDIPIAGYFYEDAARSRLVHEFHDSYEEGGLLALKGLCELLPDHPDWMDWYSGLLIHSEYFCQAGARASAPFNVVPAAVWRLADVSVAPPVDRMGVMLARNPNPLFPTPPTPELIRAQTARMFEEGVELGPHHRLRVFPLWPDHIRHGASVVQLTKAAALSAAAQLRRGRDLAKLATTQLQWVVGANPLSRSIIFGEGYDYWQNFTVSMPNLVGGMPLGFNSYADDAPAWPNNAVFPYKEQWIFSNCRVVLNLASIGMPARVRGTARGGAVFREATSGRATVMRPGRFDVALPPGEYDIMFGRATRRVSLVDGAAYDLTLDEQRWLTLELTAAADGNEVSVTAKATGAGPHEIELRAFNANLAETRVKLDLGSGGEHTMSWRLPVRDPESPWILVAIPNGAHSDLVETFGVVRELRAMG